MITSKNSLIQDILLLSKNHYNNRKTEWKQGPDLVMQMRKLGAAYCGMELEYFMVSDAAHLIVQHSIPLLQGSRSLEQILLKSLAPCPFKITRGSQTDCYWSALICSFLDELSVLVVRNPDGSNALPFGIPEPDEKIKELLAV